MEAQHHKDVWQVQGVTQPSYLNNPFWDMLLFIYFWKAQEDECYNFEEKD